MGTSARRHCRPLARQGGCRHVQRGGGTGSGTVHQGQARATHTKRACAMRRSLGWRTRAVRALEWPIAVCQPVHRVQPFVRICPQNKTITIPIYITRIAGTHTGGAPVGKRPAIAGTHTGGAPVGKRPAIDSTHTGGAPVGKRPAIDAVEMITPPSSGSKFASATNVPVM